MHVGTVAAGRIGLAVLRRLKPFDVHLHYTHRHRLPGEVERELGLTWHESAADMVPHCDVVTINCPLHPETENPVDTKHHLIVAHEVTNVGHDRTQLAAMAKQAQAATGSEELTVLADRGYFKGDEILECGQAGIHPLVPKPLTSNSKAEGRFDKRDFVYQPEQDAYRCPAGETAIKRFSTVEKGMTLHKYWPSACPKCPLKAQCIPADYRRITRWEHEAELDAMQQRLDREPEAMRLRRQTVEHAFATIKAWMGATHFLTLGIAVIFLLYEFLSKEKNFEFSKFTWQDLFGALIFLAGAVLSIGAFLYYAKAHPYGFEDAWSIWNFPARMIFRENSADILLNSQFYNRFHSDYPVALSLNVAWGWFIVRNELTRIPIAIALLSTFTPAIVLWATLGKWKSSLAGALAGLIVVLIPDLPSAVGQYADPLLALYLLAASALFYGYLRSRADGLMLLAGLLAGFSAWAKNEGLLFIGVFSIVCFLAAWKKTSPGNL